MTARTLVTGAGGFIGSHLAVALARRGQAVVALDLHLERLRPLAGEAGFELIEGDVADGAVQARALDGVDTVYHLAAAHLGVSSGPAEFQRVNVDGLRTFAARAAQAGARFVHCSSVGVYGRVADPPADETTPCHPELIYEKTKLAGEGVILEAVRDAGLQAVIVRPVWVYGPGCGRTEKLFRTIGAGRFVIAGRGDAMRHCVHIDDMIAALCLAAERDEALGEVIVVGDAEAVTVRRLADEIARLTGARPPRSVPLPLMRLAASAIELAFLPLGREPPVSRRTLRFFTANTAFDIAKARRLLGFAPRHDLASGLAATHRCLCADAPWQLSLAGAAET